MPRRATPRSDSTPPPALRAATHRLRGTEYLVLSYETGSPELPDSLTRAQRELARAVMRGKSNPEIAAERGTSPRTVANQLQAVYDKLGVRSRLELVRALRERRAS
jgi:DNA-binding NarL/FixJ family response regulator